MQNVLLVGQAFLQVLEMFWLVIPATILLGLYVNKLSEEEVK